MSLQFDLENLKYWNETPFKFRDETMASLKKIKLLTPDFASTKMRKNKQFKGYESYILHLSPSTLAFQYLGRRGTLCPMASQGCAAACLNTAGRGRFTQIQESRLRKSLYYIMFRDEFMKHLETEISKLEVKAIKNKKRLVIRLNGTSDIQWENFKIGQFNNIFERFNSVQFYDYTKIVRRLDKVSHLKNYHLTFSASESNEADCTKALSLGVNVATVFKEIPQTYNNAKVISGDDHDFRFLDQERGVIVGLKAKGKAKHDASGFVKSCSMGG